MLFGRLVTAAEFIPALILTVGFLAKVAPANLCVPLLSWGTRSYISGSAGTIVSGEFPWALSVRDLGTSDWLEGIASSTNLIVAVGDNGAIYKSSDGSEWERINKFTTWLRGIAYGDDQFICVGENGFVAASSDGSNSAQKSVPTTENLNRVAFINDTFWVVGDHGTVFTNDPSMTFSSVNVGITNDLFAVAASTNEVLIAGDSTVILRNYTNDVWTIQTDPSDPNLAPIWPYYSALWDGRLFLLGGRNGMAVEGYRTNITDPLIWYSDVQTSRKWIWGVTHVPDMYTAVGEAGTILTSADGYDWARELVPTNLSTEIFLGVAGTSNCLVTVGTSGTILYSLNAYTNVIGTNSLGQFVTNRTSLLGIIWTPVLLSPTTDDLQAVCPNQSGFIAAGANGTVLTSENGANWIKRTTPVSTYLSSVAAFRDGFIAVGDVGTVILSPDGIDWTAHSAGITNWIYSVRYADGKLVAVGEGGLILTGPNGLSWKRQTSKTSVWLNDCAFINNTWYIAGNSGIILTSPDATEWTVTSSSTSRSLNSMAVDTNQLVIAGADGMVLRTNFAVATSPVRFGSYSKNLSLSSFLFEGVIDQKFALEQKNNIEDPWTVTTVLELLDSSGTLLLQREESPADAGFFQTRLVE